MADICDNFAGWMGIGHVWIHCRGGEAACLSAELLSLGFDSLGDYAYVGIARTWAERDGQAIRPGEYVEYLEDDIIWRVHCDGVNKSQSLANIRICYSEEEPPVDPPEGMQVGDSKTVGSTTFSITSMICAPVQKIVAKVSGVSKTVVAGAIVLFPGPFIVGGLWVGLKSINAVCDRAIVEASEGGLTPEDLEEIDTLLESEYIRPDGTKPTPEEIHNVKMGVVGGWDFTDPEFVEWVKQYLEGTISREEFLELLKQRALSDTTTELNNLYYLGNFHINIPSLVMAGDISVSGDAPAQNQKIQIVAVKKFFGFDYLATDTELAKVTSDAEYKYEAVLPLNEFGIIEVYARIPKDWWAILDKDVTTAKHTVFVLTWEIVLFLIIAAALIWDKKTGKLGILKKKR